MYTMFIDSDDSVFYQTIASKQKQASGGKMTHDQFINILATEYYSQKKLQEMEPVNRLDSDYDRPAYVQGQTSANLVNLSYNPTHYRALKKYFADDIFLKLIRDKEAYLVLNGIAGLANLCLDDRFHEFILEKNGIYFIRKLLKHPDDTIKINAVASLYFLIAPETKTSICTQTLKDYLDQFSCSQNICLAKLATFFIEDQFNDKNDDSSDASNHSSDGSTSPDSGISNTKS